MFSVIDILSGLVDKLRRWFPYSIKLPIKEDERKAEENVRFWLETYSKLLEEEISREKNSDKRQSLEKKSNSLQSAIRRQTRPPPLLPSPEVFEYQNI